MAGPESNIIGEQLWDRNYAKAVDRLTSQRYGIHPLVLMEEAGRSVATIAMHQDREDCPFVVLFGPGNNGGDALVAARHLAESRRDVHLILVSRSDEPRYSDSCAAQLNTMEALGHSVRRYEPGCLSSFSADEPIIIDGILGLGFEGTLDEDSPAFQALKEVSEFPSRSVVAVDVPSGLDADCGESQPIPLPADFTVTFGGRKPAHVLAPARDLCGIVYQMEIGFPFAATLDAMEEAAPYYVHAEPEELLKHNPWGRLPPSAHKYDRGHVLVIGGSPGKTGAPLMAGMSALRGGAGWVSMAMPDQTLDTLKGDVPRELVFESLFQDGKIDAQKLEEFLRERRVKAVIAGPGTMVSPFDDAALQALARFTVNQLGFVVLDAGATQNVAETMKTVQANPEHWLVTPHPGEWKKMGPGFEQPPLTPQGLSRSRELAQGMHATLLYKGATPVAVSGFQKSPGFITDEGTLALARAGSGDVLAGVIGAHGAAGFNAVSGALRSQVVVARAAQLAAEEVGLHAVVAEDIIKCLGRVEEAVAFADDMDEDFEDDDLDEDDER